LQIASLSFQFGVFPLKNFHYLTGSLALACACVCASSFAAEIDAGAMLNKYRQELAPGFVQLPMAAQNEAQEKFNGFQIDNLPVAAQQLAKDYVAYQVGQEVIVKSLMGYLERHLQDQGFPYVFQRVEEKLEANAPIKLKAFKVSFGKVIVNNNSGLDAELAERVLSYGIESGAPVNRAQLERNSTILSEIEGISNTYQMKPGQQLGVTDLVSQLEIGRLYNGSATLDNSGSDVLGRATLRGDIALNNKLGQGDVFRAFGLITEHSQMAGVDASFLATPSGWRLGTSFSQFTYDYGTTNSLTGLSTRYEGASANTGLSATFPLVRYEFGRHTFSANLDRARSQGDATVGSSTQVNHLSDTATHKLGLSVFGIQALGNDLTGSYQAVFSSGRARQDIASAALQDAGSSQQMGHFNKLFLSGSLSKVLTLADEQVVASVAANVQLANRNLPGSEKMYFGGMSQMRAWVSQAVPTDEALYAEFKLEKQLTSQARIALFAEVAQFRQNHTNYLAAVDNLSVSTAATNKDRMSDLGISWQYQVDPQTQLKGFVAHKLSNDPSVNTKPLPDASRSRAWLSLTRLF
jgi:hemolysin activation/secretion protein